MIGTADAVQPPPPAGLPGPTPMTPVYPLRPPIAALPKPQEAPAPPTSKHPLPQPAQDGPPTNQICAKSFPRDADGKPCVSPPAVDPLNVGMPTPKGPPAEIVPTSRRRSSMPTHPLTSIGIFLSMNS